MIRNQLEMHNGWDIFPNLYSSGLCRAGTPESPPKRMAAGSVQIHGRDPQNKRQKPIIVNGVEDHAHMFVGLKPSKALSDLVRDVKNNSSNFINDHAWIKGRFNWQEGYGAFSYSHSQIGTMYDYISESRTAPRQTDLQG